MSQKKILERYCRDHGITAYRHYDEDDGYSGTNFNRPGFQRMLADIKAGKIKRVIVKDMSRFGRDYLQVGKLSDDRFIKMSHDYELEQSNLKSMAEVLRKELKQQEQQKTNAKAFVTAVKKYTDMQELDAAVLREFIDRIEVSHADKKSKTREITIVYNFIGAFDFTRAIEEAHNTTQKQQKTA